MRGNNAYAQPIIHSLVCWGWLKVLKVALPSLPRFSSAKGLVQRIRPHRPQYLLDGWGGWVENENKLYLLPQGLARAGEGIGCDTNSFRAGWLAGWRAKRLAGGLAARPTA